MALGKQQKTIRGPKPASKKSNLMWMTSLSQFPLLNHPNQKVQNSSLALRWIWREPLSAGGLTIVLFAGLGLVLESPRHLTESYGYSRPVSPLLAFVALQAIACGAWTALAFPFFVCLSVGSRVVSFVRIRDILRAL